MPDSRNMTRRERYMYLRSLGFTSSQARKFRDHNSRSIENEVIRERRRITRKSTARRTPAEQERLEKIRTNSETVTPEIRRRRTTSRGERWQDFSEWSSKASEFPDWAIARIRAYNRDKGLPPDDPFGYRRFFYWYVERIADFENEFYADRGDSGLRRQIGVSLRSKREIRNVA